MYTYTNTLSSFASSHTQMAVKKKKKTDYSGKKHRKMYSINEDVEVSVRIFTYLYLPYCTVLLTLG